MNTQNAFKLFDEMITIASSTLLNFTLNTKITIEEKADKSLVTACDTEIDQVLSKVANNAGFQVVSEEGNKSLQTIKSGNYLTIDPIDGSLGYIDYLNEALQTGSKTNFISHDLGPTHDFCLLLGIVENSRPRFGACFNYITKEKVFIDGNNKENLIRDNNIRNYAQQYAAYVDQRKGDWIEDEIMKVPGVSTIKQATVGLKSLYTILNPHESSVMCHRVQTSGLWDILPAAVASQAFGGKILDGNGQPLVLNSYAILPGKGGTVLKGDKFSFVEGLLQKNIA